MNNIHTLKVFKKHVSGTVLVRKYLHKCLQALINRLDGQSGKYSDCSSDV